jgi:aldehyde dehydrogenase (NAD+)
MLIREYMDNRCYRMVEGGHDVSDALLAQKWDMIFFTGSGSIGKQVYHAAAEHLAPAILELGGKSPCIVDSSANLDIAARRLAMGKFLNSGQTCVAPDYCLCSDRVCAQLIEKLKQNIVAFYGADAQTSEDYLRIVAGRQFGRLTKYLTEDVEKPGVSSSSSSSSSPAEPALQLPPALMPTPGGGHRIIFGGRSDADDLFIEPTIILCDVTTTSRFMQEEIFGPVLPIIPIPDAQFLQTAIRFIRGRPKPLACYLFSDTRLAKEMVEAQVSSGSLAFNECVIQLQISSLPFGGVGESGLGMYHGKFSFEAFTHRKAVLDKAKVFDLDSRYPPYTPSKLSMLKRFL